MVSSCGLGSAGCSGVVSERNSTMKGINWVFFLLMGSVLHSEVFSGVVFLLVLGFGYNFGF